MTLLLTDKLVVKFLVASNFLSPNFCFFQTHALKRNVSLFIAILLDLIGHLGVIGKSEINNSVC